MRPDDVARIFACQHGLPSTGWLFDRLHSHFRSAEVFVDLKPYSTTPAVREMIETAYPPVPAIVNGDAPTLVLDEGGLLHARAEGSNLAGVEQTSSGLRSDWRYPCVLVCRSAAKLQFEAQIIARGIIRKLRSLDLLAAPRIGILGLGAIGSSLARQLKDQGAVVVGYEDQAIPKDLEGLVAPIGEVVARSDLILGCSGADVLATVDLDNLEGFKIFASCSSADIEFRAVLARMPPRRGFGSLTGIVGKAECTILNGGFPLNFDRSTEWELFDEIVLTRQLCFEGLVQASGLIASSPRGVMLDPVAQLRVISEWLERVPQAAEIRRPAQLTVDFFRTRSEGEYLMSPKPPYHLHSTTPGALERMRSHSEPYKVDVGGRSIIVLPGVWSPAYDWSSLFYVENFPDVSGRSFLEIGCGTGVISVFAALNGASKVVAVDVNEEAVRNTVLNFERFKLDNAVALVSDGFASIHDKFDIVTWNAPYHGSRPTDMLERGCADEDYRDIRAFFRDVGAYLKPGGLVVFGFSESGDLPLIEQLIADAGLRVKQRLSDWRQGYNCMLFVLARAVPPKR